QHGAGGDASAVISYVRFVTQQRYGEWADAFSVEGEWLTGYDYRVTISGDLPVTILSAVPGFPERVPIEVRSTVRTAEPRQVYKPSTISERDNEAGTYIRIYVYCFDPEDRNDPKTRGRTQMTAIADNAKTKYTYDMPRCEADQALSYKLLNVRRVREEPKMWD